MQCLPMRFGLIALITGVLFDLNFISGKVIAYLKVNKLGVAQSRDDFNIYAKIYPYLSIVSGYANLTIIPQRCNAIN